MFSRTRVSWPRDPLVIVSADAVKTEVQIVQDGRLSEFILNTLFARAFAVASRAKPWNQVRGPGSALVLTCRRMGLTFAGPFALQEASGPTWDLRSVSTAFVARRARFAARKASDFKGI